MQFMYMEEMYREKSIVKYAITHRACAHNTLVGLSGWEQIMISERLAHLVSGSIVPTCFNRSPQPCRGPVLICATIQQYLEY